MKIKMRKLRRVAGQFLKSVQVVLYWKKWSVQIFWVKLQKNITDLRTTGKRSWVRVSSREECFWNKEWK